MYQVSLSRRAQKTLQGLHPVEQQRILDALEQLAANPRPPDAKALQAAGGFLRVRVGDYRVVYRVDDAAQDVFIDTIGHRGDVYRRRIR